MSCYWLMPHCILTAAPAPTPPPLLPLAPLLVTALEDAAPVLLPLITAVASGVAVPPLPLLPLVDPPAPPRLPPC